MNYNNIRNELNNFYFKKLPLIAQDIKESAFNRLDEYAENHPTDSSYKLKSKQYEVITDLVNPILFDDIPFFCETGVLTAFCDGSYLRGGVIHANGWLYMRNEHLFEDTDPYAFELFKKHINHGLYVQCGTYTDRLHLGIPFKKIFKVGLKGILAELEAQKDNCQTEEESDFIACATTGIKSLCRIAEKFAVEAEKQGLKEIARLASKVPFNPPETVHEGLCVLAFIRKALGSLEGMGFSSFGRVDVLLGPLYENDIKRGVTDDELLDLITKFLLVWDCTFDRTKKLELGFEYELENTLTLGGCDENGNPIFNGITKLFLKARDKEDILYPKMMLRYNENSPEEYLRTIGTSLLEGKGFSLFANDDTIIPALVDSGMEKQDAYDYAVGGCWDILLPNHYIHNSGEYFSIATPLVWSIYKCHERMRQCEVHFESLEDCKSFDELYRRYLGGVRRIAAQKATLQSRGVRVWHKVNPVCTLSALMEPCIPAKKDITAGSGKYNKEAVYLTTFSESVDSLMAIKELCFEKKVCTISELFDQCRNGWPNEALRLEAVNCPSYGDGSEQSAEFVAKFIDDMYELFSDLPTAYGGRFRIGSNHYTEIIRHRDYIPALPSGRKKGDFLSAGLTPVRKQNNSSLFDIFDSLRYVDTNKLAANFSVTLTLPAGNLNADNIVDFFRMAARSKLMSIQPNCVNKEELLAAQKDPENYSHIIVRVCGFSAQFIMLPPDYQEEVITRTVSEV